MLMRLVAVAIGIVLIQGSAIFGALLPEITGLSPNRGPTGGGTVVTLRGLASPGATSVRFDGIAGTAFAVMSDTEVRVTTPAHAAGVVDVTISGPPGSNTLAQGYGYGNVPASAEDTYAVPFNTPLQVPAPGVLENDNSNGAGTMVAAVVTDVTSGTLTLNGETAASPTRRSLGSPVKSISFIARPMTTAPATWRVWSSTSPRPRDRRRRPGCARRSSTATA